MLILILNLVLMTGCGMEEDEKEKVNDIEFTVVPEENIQVKELYETKNNIFIDTEFIGPSKSEDVSQTISYPYIVVQMEYIDKQVRSDR